MPTRRTIRNDANSANRVNNLAHRIMTFPEVDQSDPAIFRGAIQRFETVINLFPIAQNDLIDNNGNDTNNLANFIGTPEGYFINEDTLRTLVRGGDVRGVFIRFAQDNNGEIHLVFVPLMRDANGSLYTDYSNAMGTYQAVKPTPDPIYTNPPHNG